ncbi:hypothetical protein [Rubinisphaera margarita]|uniref:hypothetical protein n=1 Tax=Rubinisphaera margarita TaxID=2909586 RepID=UPI001EE8E576|nr:hypothetical protein [Rubinisphaera margarita]MCG6157020.1 hypothetical protein [Rubinisphaera margarita]
MTKTSLRICSLVIPVFALGLLTGCGGDSGPSRVPVSGKITVDGNPIELAQIEFRPNVGKGDITNAPTAFGYVKNGEYSIPEVTGAIVGEHDVTVRVVEPSEEEEDEETVVGEFRTTATVQKDGEHVHNFDFTQGEIVRPEDEEN